MKIYHYLIISGLLITLWSCGSDDQPVIEPNPEEKLVFSTPPFTLNNTEDKFAQNIAYDEASRNVFDIFLPQSNTPTPLVIYIHGGGFTSGDKSKVYSKDTQNNVDYPFHINDLLANDIAFATINYRFLGVNDTEGVQKPLKDSRRCLQYIRSKAEDFNLDKSKIVLVGASAGAGTSLWIGLQDEQADTGAADQVLRESTKVLGIAAIETQATYDLQKWETEVFKPYDFKLESFLQQNLAFPIIFNAFYGISSFEDFNTPIIQNYRKEVDMLLMMDANDPELFLDNTRTAIVNPTDLGVLYHHPYHAKVLKNKADEVGLKNVSYYGTVADPSGETVWEFLKRKLGK